MEKIACEYGLLPPPPGVAVAPDPPPECVSWLYTMVAIALQNGSMHGTLPLLVCRLCRPVGAAWARSYTIPACRSSDAGRCYDRVFLAQPEGERVVVR